MGSRTTVSVERLLCLASCPNQVALAGSPTLLCLVTLLCPPAHLPHCSVHLLTCHTALFTCSLVTLLCPPAHLSHCSDYLLTCSTAPLSIVQRLAPMHHSLSTYELVRDCRPMARLTDSLTRRGRPHRLCAGHAQAQPAGLLAQRPQIRGPCLPASVFVSVHMCV